MEDTQLWCFDEKHFFIHDCTTDSCWKSQSEWELPKSGEIGIVKDKSKGKVLEVGKRNPFVPFAVKLYSPYLSLWDSFLSPILQKNYYIISPEALNVLLTLFTITKLTLIENFLLLKVPIPDSTALVT